VSKERPAVVVGTGDTGRPGRAARDQAPTDDPAEAPLCPEILDRARQQIREGVAGPELAPADR